jgi:hypothetical protein
MPMLFGEILASVISEVDSRLNFFKCTYLIRTKVYNVKAPILTFSLKISTHHFKHFDAAPATLLPYSIYSTFPCWASESEPNDYVKLIKKIFEAENCNEIL